MIEKVRHNCGLCVAHTLHDTYSFIKSLSNRGREATGIAAVGNDTIDAIKWKGPVDRFDLVDLYKIFPSPDYHTYMAHVRYATSGRKDKILEDAHPHVIGGEVYHREDHILTLDCEVAGVHNGQVDDKYFGVVDKRLLKTGCDTEALIHLYREVGERGILRQVPGAYTLVIADKKRKDVIIIRDRTSIKPGVLGWKDGKYGVASEDIAFKENGGQFVEDLDPGSVYYLAPDGSYIKENVVEPQHRFCFFEWNYLLSPEAISNGMSARIIRMSLGETVAEEHPLDVDLVTFLPRCPEPAARSYAKKLGIPFVPVFYKMRSERAFQGSTPEDREESIKRNLHLLPKIYLKGERIDLKGKRVASIDDSTIRANNANREKNLFDMAEVEEAYHISYTPPIGIEGEDGILRGCMFGVDMPPNDNFIARGKTLEEISEAVGMNMLYISYEGMLKTYERLGMPREHLCTYCIGGKHPFEGME